MVRPLGCSAALYKTLCGETVGVKELYLQMMYLKHVNHYQNEDVKHKTNTLLCDSILL